ncbi:MAG: TRAP transporter substrate-binding protein [Tropicimonas sp.]|uniref:TRAP transporter substrate-binding protein n=1 Tax=Tropicimonas sp. TaxID=2067044 RepID=UPI003A8C19D3
MISRWKLLVTLCATITASGAATAADYTMKISVQESPPEEGRRYYSLTPLIEFEKEIEAQSDGAIDVQIFWNGQLGKVDNVVNLVRGGHVEGVITADGQVSPYYPDIQVLGIPYLFMSREIAYEVFDGPFGAMLADTMAQASGLRPLAWMEAGGYRHYSSNRPLNSADDMVGLKIRTMNIPAHMAIVEALGGSPTPISWSDLYTSLQTGVVDGQENSLSSFRLPKLEEVQKNIILDGHVYSVLMMTTSEKWLDTLPDDLRQVVMTAGEHMRDLNREISLEQETIDRTFLEEYGVRIVDLTPEEKEVFRERSQASVIDTLSESVSAEMIDAALSAVAEAEAKLAN